jgi:two-component system chemotaxis sensor kinase CheA
MGCKRGDVLSDESEMNDLTTLLRAEFLDEAAYLLEQCEGALLRLEDDADRVAGLAEIFRVAHTIKGSGAVVGFVDLVELAHAFEDCLVTLRTAPQMMTTDLTSLLLEAIDALKDRVAGLKRGDSGAWRPAALIARLQAAASLLGKPVAPPPTVASAGFGFFDDEPLPLPEAVPDLAPAAPAAATGAKERAQVAVTSVKVDSRRVDGVLDTVGELVVAKSQLLNKLSAYPADLGLQAVAALLDGIVKELQDKALGIRMTPLKPLFLKLQRLIRDLSLRFGKPVEFTMAGEETEIDRTMVEALADPLLHMMRNAIDHGIESPAVRLAAGKSKVGGVRVAARQAGGRVLLEVSEDGAGIDRARVYAKAQSRGLLPAGRALESMTDKEVFALLFAPGFSTAEVLSEVSGRGVGLDVVKTNIERLKGTIEIDSRPGAGTTFTLSLPLTTSITDAILMRVDGQSYAIPMDVVREMVARSNLTVVECGPRGRAARIRDRLIPLIDLKDIVAAAGAAGPAAADRRQRMVVVVEHETGLHGLLVDEIVGQMQIVMKPMSSALGGVRGVAGAAVMGDGKVALVLSVAEIVRPGVAGEAERRVAVGQLPSPAPLAKVG